MKPALINHLAKEQEALLARCPLDADHHQLRKASLLDFCQTTFPTPHDEAWKYTHPNTLLDFSFGCKKVPLPDSLPIANTLDSFAICVFVDGFFVPSLSTIPSICTDWFQTADRLFPFWIRSGSHEPAIDDLLGAFYQDGLHLRIPKNTSLQKPIQLLFVSTGQENKASSLPVCIQVEQNSHAIVLEQHIALADAKQLDAVSLHIGLMENASLEHVRVFQGEAKTHHLSLLQAKQKQGSAYRLHTLCVGGAWIRNDVHMQLQEMHSECFLNGLVLGQAKQHIDNHVLVEHQAPNTKSNQTDQGLFLDDATGILDASIEVKKGADGISAHQHNANWLLSDNATIHAKPHLRIHTDAIQCTHGSSIGQLDEHALFYLQSRGLSFKESQHMLCFALTQHMLAKIQSNAIHALLESQLFDVLQAALGRSA